MHIADFSYLALSYVWGPPGSQKLVIKRENMRDLGKPGSLLGKVSKTIQDAMAVTEMLGFQYIWIDGLCILQDDTPDKGNHLSFMGQIYMNAQLTIVAANGSNAGAGLTGVDEPRQYCERRIKVQDATANSTEIHLMTAQIVRGMWDATYLSGTTWSTRGWTLQEKALSRRTLVFTKNQVYWSCRNTTWAEDNFTETNLIVSTYFDHLNGPGTGFLNIGSTSVAADDTGTRNAWEELGLQMSEFSNRTLGWTGDAYDAFSGVLQEFTKATGEYLLWAIPASRFELGLCWSRHAVIGRGGTRSIAFERREGLSTMPTTTLNCKVPFPSWSWLGWIGSVNVTFTDQYAETGYVPTCLGFPHAETILYR